MTGQLSPLAQGKAAGTTGYTSKLLKTGQTTQYDSELDDGYYEVGVARSWTINTTGAQSGTTNVDLAHYAGGAGAIAFNNTDKKITDSGAGLAIFKTNDVILTSSASNPGPFTVTTGNNAGEIVCSGATFTNETPAGEVTLYKREAASNNTVLENNTGLEWKRYWSTKMGLTSIGTMPFSGKLYDIFAYCAACNAVSVGGHNDWRVCNYYELITIYTCEVPNAQGYLSQFPNINSYDSFSSTTLPSDVTKVIGFNRANSYGQGVLKTNGGYYFLVRGGLS